jgi:hypothetical protein
VVETNWTGGAKTGGGPQVGGRPAARRGPRWRCLAVIAFRPARNTLLPMTQMRGIAAQMTGAPGPARAAHMRSTAGSPGGEAAKREYQAAKGPQLRPVQDQGEPEALKQYPTFNSH